MNQEEADLTILDISEKMDKAVSHVLKEFAGLRTGKASPSLVDSIMVEAYGSRSRIKDVAGISAPEPRLLVIQPWDQSILDAVSKAISKANIGITPIVDGKIIRIPIPELSSERREEMKKIARKMAEESRIGVRNIRREGNDAVKALLKDSKITEDDKKSLELEIQELTDKHIAKIDNALSDKEKELENT